MSEATEATEAGENRNPSFQVNPKSNDPAEMDLLNRLKDNLEGAEISLWRAGEIINQLKDKWRWTTKELAHLFRQRANRLDELAKTARLIPEPMRRAGLTFSDHLVARKSAKAVSDELVRTGVDPAARPDVALALSEMMANPDLKLGKGRRLTKHLIRRERQRREPERIALLQQLKESNRDKLRQMILGDCIAALPKLSTGTIALVHLDPPYADYRRTSDGKLDFGSRVGNFECDNNSREEAKEATISALWASLPLLKQNGVILLWQAAVGLQWEISKAIEELGLVHYPFLIWNKSSPQMGDPSTAVMFSAEVCYVLVRNGERPLGFDDSQKRSQVLDVPRQIQRAHQYLSEPFPFRKPEQINTEILERFTQPGDIVVDAFGGSGSFCEAAQKLNREWIYIESNPTNYQIGKRNLENLLLETKTKSA